MKKFFKWFFLILMFISFNAGTIAFITMNFIWSYDIESWNGVVSVSYFDSLQFSQKALTYLFMIVGYGLTYGTIKAILYYKAHTKPREDKTTHIIKNETQDRLLDWLQAQQEQQRILKANEKKLIELETKTQKEKFLKDKEASSNE